MSDVLKMAQAKRDKLQVAIGKREAEIARLNDEIKQIDSWMNFAENLKNDDPSDDVAASAPPAAEKPQEAKKVEAASDENDAPDQPAINPNIVRRIKSVSHSQVG